MKRKKTLPRREKERKKTQKKDVKKMFIAQLVNFEQSFCIALIKYTTRKVHNSKFHSINIPFKGNNVSHLFQWLNIKSSSSLNCEKCLVENP